MKKIQFLVSFDCKSDKNNSVKVLINRAEKDETAWSSQKWFSLNYCQFEFLEGSKKYGTMTVPKWLFVKMDLEKEVLINKVEI